MWCGYLHIREEHGRIGTVWLHILHGVPLIDAYLVGGDPALIVADPGEEQAAWEVVVTTSHLARFMEWLEGWPTTEWVGGEKKRMRYKKETNNGYQDEHLQTIKRADIYFF